MSNAHHAAPAKTPVEEVLAHKWSFLFFFALIFLLSFQTLSGIGMIPSSFAAFSQMPTNAPIVAEPETPAVALVAEGELPVRIKIPAIGVEANVSNPNTTRISALDQALLTGAVRYPGTGTLGAEGNVLIFGHSSYLPVVHNQAYKAFNGIQNLKEGDLITVYGKDKAYTYAVETVEQSNTESGEIPLDVSGSKLTLATCDTFGAKSDRFIVTAKLYSTEALGNGT